MNLDVAGKLDPDPPNGRAVRKNNLVAVVEGVGGGVEGDGGGGGVLVVVVVVVVLVVVGYRSKFLLGKVDCVSDDGDEYTETGDRRGQEAVAKREQKDKLDTEQWTSMKKTSPCFVIFIPEMRGSSPRIQSTSPASFINTSPPDL